MKPRIKDLLDPKQALKWTIVHIALGAVTTVVPWLFIIYFYLFFFFNFNEAYSRVRRGDITMFILFMSYIFGFELLARMTKSNPYVPHEFVKYLMILFGVMLLVQNPKKPEKTGLVILVLILPGLFIDHSGLKAWSDIVGCVLGPIGLALSVATIGNYSPPPLLINKVLRLIWLPFVSILINMYLKTPDYEDINFQLSASRAATGGASSNQASTILGFGMFLSFFSMYKGEGFSSKKLLDLAFVMLFAFQGLLTFSRAGMLVGVIAIVLLLLISGDTVVGPNSKKRRKKGFPIMYLLLGFAFLVATYSIVDNITGGKLTLRYQGETNATAAGNAEKDLDRMTSGRSNIIDGEMKIWSMYPLFGAGGGSSAHLRTIMYGEAFLEPHVEPTRLLAEHGLLGLFVFFILIYIGWKSWLARKMINSGNLIFIIFVIAFLSSFHSSTRTFVTPFLIGLSSMTLRKPPTYRRI